MGSDDIIRPSALLGGKAQQMQPVTYTGAIPATLLNRVQASVGLSCDGMRCDTMRGGTTIYAVQDILDRKTRTRTTSAPHSEINKVKEEGKGDSNQSK